MAGATLLAAWAVVVMGGCESQLVQSTSARLELGADSIELWRACQEELRSRMFRIDRADRRSGVIESHPRVSSQWFELWGRDTATARDWGESSLHTVRRTVRVEAEPMGAGGCEVVCKVVVERWSTGPTEVPGSMNAADVLQEVAERSGDSGGGARREGRGEWVLLGEDEALAADIVSGIGARVAGL